jgi:hypothetical protein
MGGFAEIYWKYNIFSVFFADREKFLSTEIRKAGVMIRLLTIHHLNTYFRIFITVGVVISKIAIRKIT